MGNTNIRAGCLCALSLAVLGCWAVTATARPISPKATVINVIAGRPSEFRFTLSTMSVKTGTVIFVLTDKGALHHSFKICSNPEPRLVNSCVGRGTAAISPGGSATLTVILARPGMYEYLCTVPGHAAQGMKGDLKVNLGA